MNLGFYEKIKEVFTPSNMVNPGKYYLDFLKESDSVSLWDFVYSFSDKMGITSSAVIAVGSSTFPKSFWRQRRRANKKEGFDAPESYRDIDLLVLPEEREKFSEFEKSVTKSLESIGLEFERKEDTLDGVSYNRGLAIDSEGNRENVMSSWVNVDYGRHSVSTRMENGTKIDLIIGRPDIEFMTASEKIKEDLANNESFSVLSRYSLSSVPFLYLNLECLYNDSNRRGSN